MGTWMDGCVPDSSRYVPGRSADHVSAVGEPTTTSVPNDCTRGPCTGGVPGVGAGFITMGQVTLACACEWSGLGVVVRWAKTPRPPPTCPTIISDVGTVFAVVAPVGVKERLFVRLIVSACPVGTVITTGDQPLPTFGFNEAQVAVEPVTTAPQL